DTAPPLDAKLEAQILEVIRKHPEVILQSVEDYQTRERAKQEEAQKAAVKKVTADPKQAIGTSPTIGKGKVLLLEFSDFQCPYCAAVRENLKQFAQKYPNDVTLVYKHFPLTRIHDQALPAAMAAWAAGQQGKFWEFHDALFGNQKTLSDAFYQETAKGLNLNIAKFNADRKGAEATRAIAADVAMAESLSIDGTPTFCDGWGVVFGAGAVGGVGEAAVEGEGGEINGVRGG
ncbi:MAG: thioredoxin domain-containing protein, partial [Alkalinema sp. RU_4_3]|nr:thioredoxin domain-containing protein [Alkalinema sp. RU_4_3]